VAVESLRATRRIEPSGELVTLSAADPLNLVGVIVPGERVPSVSTKFVTFRDGVAVEPHLKAPAIQFAAGVGAKCASMAVGVRLAVPFCLWAADLGYGKPYPYTPSGFG